MEFRYLLPAEEEMTEAALFYEEQAKGLGAEFLDDVERAIIRLLDNPEFGPVVSADLRRSLLSRFPFSLIYAIEPQGILIVAVAHQRMRPYYWSERIKR
jgi:toxin ParE1/3/4